MYSPDERTVDAALVTRSLAGDRDAFRDLVERYRVRVYNRCWMVVGVASDAEDVAQETFVRAYQHLAKFDPKYPFGAWLLTIARNLALNYKQRRPPAADPLPEEGAGRKSLASPGADPAKTIEDRESMSAIRSAIWAIQQEFREALALRYVEGLKYEEIAARLKVPMGTVKSRIFKGRDRLVELLAEKGLVPR